MNENQFSTNTKTITTIRKEKILFKIASQMCRSVLVSDEPTR